MVDEATSDDDTTYLEASATGQLQLFKYDGLSGSPTLRRADQHGGADGWHLYKLLAGHAGLRWDCEHRGCSDFGSSYATAKQIKPLDAKGNSWTAANLNATQFGFTT